MKQVYKKISTTKAITYAELSKFEPDMAVVAEEKFDGSRVGVIKHSNAGFSIVSTQGKDKTKNLPYIIKSLKSLNIPNDTILDCEVVHLYALKEDRWSLSRSVMGSNGFNPDIPPSNLIIFDVQRWAGIDLTKGFSFRDRRACVEKIFEDRLVKCENSFCITNHIAYPTLFTSNVFLALALQIKSEKGEGIMIKALDTLKYADWHKVKQRFHIDAVVLGMKKGKGKYKHTLGALRLGLYDDKGAIIDIGYCSGMSDKDRAKFYKRLPSVVEVSTFEVTKGLKLRHPVFIRERDDKDKLECKLEQLRGVLSATRKQTEKDI